VTPGNDGRLLRAFTGLVSDSQRTSAKGWPEKSDERKVECYCELYRQQLPKGDVVIDLDKVAKE
jgi:hypothetical protein